MIVDGYVRVSQVGGRGGERFISPSVQREQIERWAASHGALVTQVFEELDESGGRPDRPLLEEAISRVERGDSHGVVVAYMSRFGRSHLDGLIAIDRITRAGGIFASVQEGLDFSTDIGRHMLRQMLSWAEWELDRTRTDWNKARERAVARGAWMSSPPFGYRRGPDGRLVPDHVQAPVVVELFRRRAEGASIRELLDFLAETGINTREGREWTSSGVGKMLKYRTYLGELRHGEYRNPAAHEPLVDELLWQRAQVHNLSVPPPRQRTPTPLLQGILRCAGCRRMLQSAPAQADFSYASRWYFCRDGLLNAPCPRPATVSDAVVEPYLEELMWQELAGGRRSAGAKRIAALEAEIARRERDVIAYRDNTGAASALGAQRFADGLAGRVERAERKRTELWRARMGTSGTCLPDPERLREDWPSMDLRARRDLLAKVFDCAFLAPGRRIEERLFVYRRGSGPVDLPPWKPHRPFEARPFDPSTCPAPIRLRERQSLWPDTRLHQELAAFNAERDRWPTFADFQAAGRADLYVQVHRQGGARYVAAALRLPYVPPRLDRRMVWTEERVRSELRTYLDGKRTWPTCKRFAADGRGALRHAVREFGGSERWASELGICLPERQRARPKWSYLRLKEELAAFARGRCDWPPLKEFEAADRLTLYHAVRRSGARAQLAADLGLQVPADRVRARSPTRWTEDTIRASLDLLMEGRASWPSWTDFKDADLTGLYAVLLQAGTRERWAREYGLKAPRRRSRLQGQVEAH